MPESPPHLDALVVGAGFSGIHTLNKLRKLGFSAKIYEAGSSLGGTWFWNRYPGARVDSETPVYQILEDKEAWSDFEFTERFPGYGEFRRYFAHIDKKLDLSKDIFYNTTVTAADWDEARNLWSVKTDQDSKPVLARHLILCTGFAAKKYTPAFPGLDSFTGEVYHSADWPHPREDGTSVVDLKGKRVAVIGTGASGVQIIQEIGTRQEASSLTVYQRTPNLALPMRQTLKNADKEDPSAWKFPAKSEYQTMFTNILSTFGGIRLNFVAQKWAEASPEERRAIYEETWAYGGFGFWLGTYMEIFFVKEANDEVYAFWAEKVRPRISDPVKRDLLAPLTPPHAWGTKRPSLEQTYYEVYNHDNVSLVDVNEAPIAQITASGIRTEKETTGRDFDVIIFATGFDSVTGGILKIAINGVDNLSIQDKWGDGVRSFLGMTAAGFPNMYWLYGPQAPTAFSNGPTCSTIQGSWIADLLEWMRTEGKTRVEAEVTAETGWVTGVHQMWDGSLFAGTKSWYQGSNIPGKKVEPLNYIGGIPGYRAALGGCKEKEWEGFRIG